MASIEPGDVFDVEYGSGRKVQVKALSLREERQAIKLVSSIQNSGGNVDVIFDAIEALLKLLCVNYSDTFIDDNRINRSAAMEIANKAINAGSLTEDERKKSGSQPSSAAV